MKTIFETKLKSSRVYLVDSQNRDFIDKKFNKLHREKKMSWTTKVTFFDFLVFVVWKIIYLSKQNSIKKSKVIINIREFNEIIESNDYFMFLQSNVINSINDCFYVNVINTIDFFYQWLIKITNRHKFIVISYKNNEQFNVVVMNFRNNSTYMQRQIDVIL